MNRPIRVRRLCACLLALACCAPASAQQAEPLRSDLLERRDALDKEFAKRLEALAIVCDKNKLPSEAKTTRGWVIARDPRRQYLFLPEEVDPVAPKEGAASLKKFWYKRFRKERGQQANRLMKLATEAAQGGQGQLAFQWIHEALREDPDHEAARAVLGYRQVDNRWRRATSKIAVTKQRAPNGPLGFAGGRHWRIRSANFQIQTNHGPQEGRRLAEQLEILHDLWRQVFFRYWSSSAKLVQQIEKPEAATRPRKQFKVVLFRDRAGYVQVLGRAQPLIDKTVGIYLDQRRTAYFYVGDQDNESTRLHEATHQLFSEAAKTPRKDIAARANFWVVEAIALYMESLQHHGGYYTVGGFNADRLQFARYRANNERFYLPLAQLVRMGRDDLQKHEEIRRLYSQSAGLASYLMDHQRGLHRDKFIDYVQAVYLGRDTASTLFDRLEITPEDADSQYREFLDVADRDFVLAPPQQLRRLAIGHTRVSDAALARIGPQPRLEWLDLAFTKVGDEGVAHLVGCRGLKQLNLESTAISDAALQTVAQLATLEELDLSHTAITDSGLRALQTLKQLKVLWLTGTQVGDAGLKHLRPLRSLETLDVSKSRVTEDGLRSLRTALPNLK